MRTKKKNIKLWIISLLAVFVILPVGWILLVELEGEKPSISLNLSSASLGVSQELSLTVSDKKSGVRKVQVGLIKDGREVILLTKAFPSAGVIGGGTVREETFNIPIEPKKLGLSDGNATLRLAAWDFSWRQWWRGNRVYLEKAVVIDTKPPQIDVLTRFHNINQGGAALIIYKISEPCPKSGVYVGDNFFPGHAGYFKDPNTLLAFFALSFQQGAGTEMLVKATDPAGNTGRSGFPYYIKKRVFKNDTLTLSERFLNWKMPEFSDDLTEDAGGSVVEKFLGVNRRLRKANYEKFTELGQTTDRKLYWEGSFLRLPKSATRATFADQRAYKYKGHIIDRQVHLGIDLASISHSPIPAANNGRIAFVGSMGIYGRTVMIDHGFGVFSIYAHLSGSEVKRGEMVSKGDIIGRTGMTGLAGGDHLHFGVLIHNTFVNPLEWWDGAWIKNNISSKINTVRSGIY